MILLALLRFVRRTPWSALMALLGVALGISSIVSVHLISAQIAQRLDGLVPLGMDGYSHFVHGQTSQVDEYFALRRAWRQSSGGPSQIRAMGPIIDETVVLAGQSVRVVGLDLVQTMRNARLDPAVDTLQSSRLWGVWATDSVLDAVFDGRLGEVVVNGRLASESDLLIGDIGTVQALLGWSAERISYVGVALVDPWQVLKNWGEPLLPGMGAGLPDATVTAPLLQGRPVLSVAAQHPAGQFGKAVLFNVSALAMLSLLVAWFLIYQVAVTWLRRLWPIFSRLHVLGVSWRRLGLYFLVVMTSLALPACALGLLAGHGLAQILFEVVVGAADQVFVTTPWLYGKALASALGVCWLGGGWAFRQALPRSRRRVHRGWIVAVLLLLMVVGVASPAMGLTGGFLAIAASSLGVAFVVAPLLEMLRRRADKLSGPYLWRWSLREAVWYPLDLSVAVSGLALAVATAIGVGIMVDSFRVDFSRMLERRLSHDLVVTGTPQTLRRAHEWLAAQPSVSRLQVYRQQDLRIQGVPLRAVAARLDLLEAARYGHPRALLPDEVLLSEQGARALAVEIGGWLDLDDRRLQVAGIFSSFGDTQPRILLPIRTADAASAWTLQSLGVATTDPGALAAALLQAVPEARVGLQQAVRIQALRTFDQTFVITTVLILIALLVASIGIYIAITTLRLNRLGGQRLMSVLGLGPLETAAMDLGLGLAIGLLALLLAVPLGLLFGWILCEVINPRAFGWSLSLRLHGYAVLEPAVWGLLAAMAAGTIRLGHEPEGALRRVV